MKYLNQYDEFLEFLFEKFSSSDKAFIKSEGELFTVAVEYEIASTEDPDEEPAVENEESALQNAYDQTVLDLKRGKTVGTFGFSEEKWTEEKFKANEKEMLEDNDITNLDEKKIRALHKKYKTWTWFQNFIETLKNKIDFEDETKTYDRLNPENFKNPMEQIVANRYNYNIALFLFSQNVDYLKQMAEEHLPNFWKKWNKTFKFEIESDYDKKRILEMSPKTYLSGIKQAAEQITDFYNDLNEQKYWELNNRTALHINVGVKDKGVVWNPIKGLLMMGDYNREEKAKVGSTPYVFQGVEWRLGNRFTGSILDALKRNLSGELANDWNTEDIVVRYNLSFRNKEEIESHKKLLQKNTKMLDIHDIEKFEKFFNPFLIKMNKDFYLKEFGIKLTELDKNYVEFRYVGNTIIEDDPTGGVSKELLLEKMYYFCYIVYCMTDEEYKRDQYHKKLYKFLEDIKKYLE